MSENNHPWQYTGRLPEQPADTLAHALNITFGGNWNPSTQGNVCRADHKSGVTMYASLDHGGTPEETRTACRATYAPNARFPGFGATPIAAYANMVAQLEAEVEATANDLAQMRMELEAMKSVLGGKGITIKAEDAE